MNLNPYFQIPKFLSPTTKSGTEGKWRWNGTTCNRKGAYLTMKKSDLKLPDMENMSDVKSVLKSASIISVKRMATTFPLVK